MKFEVPRSQVEHAIAQRLCFEQHGDWRYDAGDERYDGYLREARRILKAIRDTERACREQQNGGGD